MPRHQQQKSLLDNCKDFLTIAATIIFILFAFNTFFRGLRSEDRQIILVDSTLKLEENSELVLESTLNTEKDIRILTNTTLRIENELINFFNSTSNATIP